MSEDEGRLFVLYTVVAMVHMIYVTEFAKRGLIHASDLVTL